MARWKLTASHHLNIEGNEWEYTETDRKTNRPRKVRFPVPRLLDINDPGDWTRRWGNKDNEEGEIVVAYSGKGDDSDLIFTGDPTPDMIPLDDEAKAITASFTERWRYKPETSEVTHSQSLIDRFSSDLEAAKAKAEAASTSGMDKLVDTMNEMMKQNAALIAALGNKAVERRP